MIHNLLLDEVPQEALGARVHACGGLIQQHHCWATHQRHCHAQLALVPSAVCLTHPARHSARGCNWLLSKHFHRAGTAPLYVSQTLRIYLSEVVKGFVLTNFTTQRASEEAQLIDIEQMLLPQGAAVSISLTKIPLLSKL